MRAGAGMARGRTKGQEQSYAAPNLINVDFEDGTDGALRGISPVIWTPTYMSVVNDPTPRATGKVLQIQYPGTLDRAVQYVPSPAIGYNYTLWFRGKVFIPSNTIVGVNLDADADWDGTHNRKLIDFKRSGGGIRMTLHRVGTNRDLKFSYCDARTGTEVEYFDPDTLIDLADDTWHTIEVQMITNSAHGVADGQLHIYMNGAASPTYSRTTGLQWIQDSSPGTIQATSFDSMLIGSQLTIDGGDPGYTGTRYWDDIAFSTSRIGP